MIERDRTERNRDRERESGEESGRESEIETGPSDLGYIVGSFMKMLN